MTRGEYFYERNDPSPEASLILLSSQALVSLIHGYLAALIVRPQLGMVSS